MQAAAARTHHADSLTPLVAVRRIAEAGSAQAAHPSLEVVVYSHVSAKHLTAAQLAAAAVGLLTTTNGKTAHPRNAKRAINMATTPVATATTIQVDLMPALTDDALG